MSRQTEDERRKTLRAEEGVAMSEHGDLPRRNPGDSSALSRAMTASEQRDELLAALKQALHVLCEYPTPGVDPDSLLERCEIAERMARAAIAKAEAQ